MKQFEFENGDLELLALGLLPEEAQKELITAMEANAELRLEFEAIENSLLQLALENEVEAPKDLEFRITQKLFEGNRPSKLAIVFNSLTFKLAASVLLVGSILFNLYLMKGNTVSELRSYKPNSSGETFILESKDLPFDENTFDEMFAFLKLQLSETPCEMDFRVTKRYLESHKLNTPENIKFLQEHHGHCDCEVLMNVAQYFPKSRFHHGATLPKVHGTAKNMPVSFLRKPMYSESSFLGKKF